MRAVMMGTGVFAEPTFEAVLARPGLCVGLFTQPDRTTGAERGTTRQTGRGMKPIAYQHGVPVFQPESINTPEGVEMLRSLAPDVVVVAAYGQILKDAARAVPPLGFFNVHASLLPKYRGAAPINWALYHGEVRTGVTIFRIGAGVDTGEVFAQEAIDVGPDETAGDVEARLAPLGARLALSVLDAVAAGTAVGSRQDSTLASKAPKLKKEDGVIVWTRTPEQVCWQVRAMLPWPTAYTFWHRAPSPAVRLIVHRARPTSFQSADPPGTILPGANGLHVVAGGGGVVEVLEVQPAGKARMSAADFVRGRRPQPGDRLGPEGA